MATSSGRRSEKVGFAVSLVSQARCGCCTSILTGACLVADYQDESIRDGGRVVCFRISVAAAEKRGMADKIEDGESA